VIKGLLVCYDPDKTRSISDFISEIHFIQLIHTCDNTEKTAAILSQEEIELVLTNDCQWVENNLPLKKIILEKQLPLLIIKQQENGFYLDYCQNKDNAYEQAGFNKFIQLVNSAYKKLLVKETAHTNSPLQKYIFVRTNHKLVKINLDDIYCFEGLKDYTKIYTRDDKFLLTLRSLKSFEMILPSSFIRVHRSYIVSFDKIESISRNRILVGKHSIPISDSLKDQFFGMLQLYI
jgi:two-component system, LytTR family, response regulator